MNTSDAMREVCLELLFQVLCEHGGEIKPSISCIVKNTFCGFSSYLTECFFLWVYLSTSPTTIIPPPHLMFPRHFTLNTSKIELSLCSSHFSLYHEMPLPVS